MSKLLTEDTGRRILAVLERIEQRLIERDDEALRRTEPARRVLPKDRRRRTGTSGGSGPA
ncbi:hypothetical protein [Miltoncostaea marina]|uniref:hypothetical protein n=1 Tax=Miltoncostaea marina TaxID=2843215 RepID=UPI001C3DB6F3|nr:hypothetical protein [Miltoncostaea marina]